MHETDLTLFDGLCVYVWVYEYVCQCETMHTEVRKIFQTQNYRYYMGVWICTLVITIV